MRINPPSLEAGFLNKTSVITSLIKKQNTKYWSSSLKHLTCPIEMKLTSHLDRSKSSGTPYTGAATSFNCQLDYSIVKKKSFDMKMVVATLL